MRYATTCSGIEAPSVAWHDFGWTPVFFAQFDPEHDYRRGPDFPSAVLAAHWPGVPNLGDITQHDKWSEHAIDLLVAGTPCQDFSVAGLRAGIAGARGSLTVEFVRILERFRPRWFLFENVPGMLSSDEGRGFGCFLELLAERGYGYAWRTLDAQYFDLAQQRERVFVVGYLGDWRPPAAVLFEPESLRGDPSPRRSSRAHLAACLRASPTDGRGYRGADVDETIIAFDPTQITHPENRSTARPGQPARALAASAHPRAIAFNWDQWDCEFADRDSSPALRGGTHNAPAVAFPLLEPNARTGRSETDRRIGTGIRDDGDPMFTLKRKHAAAVAFKPSHYTRGKDGAPSDVHWTLTPEADKGDQEPVVCTFQTRFARNGRGAPADVVPTLTGVDAGDTSDMRPCVQSGMTVRRLTPREYERLQGFPDDFTLIPYRGKPAADSPRYKAIGNSMPVPVVRWLGRRIALVQKLLTE